MKVNTESTFLFDGVIKKLEDMYKAKYVFESCLKDSKGNYINNPAAIFYTEEPHPRGSHYFAVYQDFPGNLVISNGISATEGEYNGVVVDDEVYYSRFRHDYREVGNIAIDGGRDYLRLIGDGIESLKQVRFYVLRDQLVIIE
jgi:hypothetical protein